MERRIVCFVLGSVIVGAVGSGTVRGTATGRPEGCYLSRFRHDLRRLCFRSAVCTEKGEGREGCQGIVERPRSGGELRPR